MKLWPVILIAVAAVIVSAVVTFIVTRRKDTLKVAYMLDAVEDGEVNFRFRGRDRFSRTLNRLRGIFERQRQHDEHAAFSKLIRVLTHEIMNTVTPISALSDALSGSIDENGHSELDIKAGLETISESSKSLVDFVQEYRALSGVAKPQRKTISVAELLQKSVTLNSDFVASFGASLSLSEVPAGMMIYADEGQISQILTNLVKNAVQAGASSIKVSARTDADDSVVISVSNDGEPIPVQVEEQMFVPFFTTKTEGSGIGLSISRQIMRSHGGSLDLLRSTPTETTFALIFR